MYTTVGVITDFTHEFASFQQGDVYTVVDAVGAGRDKLGDLDSDL